MQSDSGGPIVCRFGDNEFLSGAVSFGFACGSGRPSANSEMSYFTNDLQEAMNNGKKWYEF